MFYLSLQLLKKSKAFKMHSKEVLSIVVLMFVCYAYASPFRVHSIEIFTSDCDDCGVGVFGEISVKVIIENVGFHLKFQK